MDIRYFDFVSEPKSLDGLGLPDEIIGKVDENDVRSLVEGYRKYGVDFQSYLENKVDEWIKSAPVEEGGESLIPKLFKYGTVIYGLLHDDIEASPSESGDELPIGILRSLLKYGCDDWIDKAKWTKSASLAVKSFLDYLTEDSERLLWDESLYWAIECYVEHCGGKNTEVALQNALDRALFIEWKESPGRIWSVDDRFIADALFCSVDEDGDVWSYHDGFYFQESYQEKDECLTKYLTSQGCVFPYVEPGEWRLNGKFVFEYDVPKKIRKECPYCEFVLKKDAYFYEPKDEEPVDLDFDSSLEDRSRLD